MNWSEMSYAEQRRLLGLPNVAWYVTTYQLKRGFQDIADAFQRNFGGRAS